jgi:hypothetical protein
MKNKNLINEDIESIRYMMNYNTRKTLTENCEILNEVEFGGGMTGGAGAGGTWETNTPATNNTKTPTPTIADANTVTKTIYEKFPCLKTEYKYIKYVNRTDIKPPAITLYFENIKTKKIYEIFTNGRAVDKQTNKMMTFSCGSTFVGGGSQKPQIPIPPQLKDSAGVKKFQEWVVGIKGDKTILGGYGADGKFGGRTSKAWTTYGNEYLNPKLETLKPLEVTTVTPTTPAQTIGGNTQPQPEPELQLPNNQLQQAPQTNQNMTGQQKRQFNRFVKKQERMKKRNQNQNQTKTNAIDSATPQTNTNQPGSTNA